VREAVDVVRQALGRERLTILDVGGYYEDSDGTPRLPSQQFLGDQELTVLDLPACDLPGYVQGDGPLAATLRARVDELRLGDRVRWLGSLAQPKLVDLYQRATALVVPSTDEGLGLVAVEAQLCETPVVAYESGGLTDTVQHDRTGLLVPPGDVKALASTLDGLLDRSERGAELGRAGRIVALAGFAPESAARRYAGIYRSVVGSPER